MNIELLPSEWYGIGYTIMKGHHSGGSLYRFGERLMNMTKNLTDAEPIKLYLSHEEAEWAVKYRFSINGKE